MPETNQRVGPYEVDFLWREERLAVELDGYAYHSDRVSFVSDRARDRVLHRLGYAVLRFADAELEAAPPEIAGALRRSSRGPRSGRRP